MLQFPTLFIGLGGSGFLTVSRIKEIIASSSPNGVPSGAAFLCLDYDPCERSQLTYEAMFKKKSILDASAMAAREWLKVSGVASPDEYFNWLNNGGERSNNSFFPKENRSAFLRVLGSFDLSAGAGQRRILGKIGFSYPTANDKVMYALNLALNPLLHGDIEGVANRDRICVRIIGSVSGGAGSGMLLDVICMVAGLIPVGIDVEIMTFSYLPEVLIDQQYPGISESLIYGNAYGTIRELEYLYNHYEEFVPSNFNGRQINLARLPRANFLINNRHYKGVKLRYPAMIDSVANAVSLLSANDNGLNGEWVNYPQSMIPNDTRLPHYFCSLAFTRLLFRKRMFERYVMHRIFEKAYKDFTINNGSAGYLAEVKGRLREICANPLVIIPAERRADFEKRLNELHVRRVSAAQTDTELFLQDLRNSRQEYENKIKTLVREYAGREKVKSLVTEAINSIINSSESGKNIRTELLELKQYLADTANPDNASAPDGETASAEQSYKDMMEAVKNGRIRINEKKSGFFGLGQNNKEAERRRMTLLMNEQNRICHYIKDTLTHHLKRKISGELLREWIRDLVETIAPDKALSRQKAIQGMKNTLNTPYKEDFSKDNEVFLDRWFCRNR